MAGRNQKRMAWASKLTIALAVVWAALCLVAVTLIFNSTGNSTAILKNRIFAYLIYFAAVMIPGLLFKKYMIKRYQKYIEAFTRCGWKHILKRDGFRVFFGKDTEFYMQITAIRAVANLECGNEVEFLPLMEKVNLKSDPCFKYFWMMVYYLVKNDEKQATLWSGKLNSAPKDEVKPTYQKIRDLIMKHRNGEPFTTEEEDFISERQLKRTVLCLLGEDD